MQYSTLIAQIEADIYSNGAELITGDILQTVLKRMVSAWASAGAAYGGTIAPDTVVPLSLDQATVYLALTAGTYEHFLDGEGDPIETTGPALVIYDGGPALIFTKTDLPIPQIVNNLTTDDATKGLSAAQGMVLGKELYGESPIVSLPATTESGGYYSGNAGSAVTFNSNTGNYTPYGSDSGNLVGIDISDYIGDILEIVRSGADTSGRRTQVANSSNVVLTSIAPSSFVDIGGGKYSYSLTIPSNAKYLYFSCVNTASLDSITIKRANPYTGVLDRVSLLESDTKKVIQPSGLPTLPYKVYRIGEEYGVEDIVETKESQTELKYYVNSSTGADTNVGSSIAPFKTLKKALSVGIIAGKTFSIIIENDAVFFHDDLYGEAGVGYTCTIRARQNAVIICGVQTNYTLASGYTNTYESEDTGKTLVGLVNTAESNKDAYGLYKHLTKVGSVASVESTEGTYYISGGKVYVHPSNPSDLVNYYPMTSGYQFRFTALNARDVGVYLKNLNVIGGAYNGGHGSPTDTNKVEIVMEHCVFQHNFSTDLAMSNNWDVAYFVNCKAGYGKADCFNHHAGNMGSTARLNQVTICVNCVAEMAGIYASGTPFNSNLYTAHEGINVLRCNCIGMNSEGPLVADVNGCYSVNLDCDVANTYFTTGNVNITASYVFNSVSGDRTAKSILQHCFGYDVRIAALGYSDGEILISRISDYARLTAPILGIIEHL